MEHLSSKYLKAEPRFASYIFEEKWQLLRRVLDRKVIYENGPQVPTPVRRRYGE